MTDSPELGRREMLGLAATAALATALAAEPAAAQAPTYTPKPLPFDPKAVTGLSEKLLTSHHDNNYAGAVRRLGAIQGELGKIDWATAPVFQVNGLKREELLAYNSMLLHEVYFASIGAPTAPSPALAAAIEKSFGSQAKWAAEYSGVGKALGGGSGWVLLTWDPREKKLVNTWAADHTHTLGGGTPILALDMYEHAYHMDYGSAAARYVDAYMKVIDWRNASALYAKVSAA
ncbi:MAG: superoxide dismutase [Caulobacteraceae bacterium]